MKTKESIPKFHEAVMWMGADQPKWSVKAELEDGTTYELKYLATDELRKYDLFRRKMIEMSPIFLPTIKQGDWEQIIGPVMASKLISTMPEDTTEVGILRGRMREFLAKTDFNTDPEDIKARANLNRGVPVYQMFKGSKVIMFRSQDFDKYLRDVKMGDIAKTDRWLKISSELNASAERIKVMGESRNMWVINAEEFMPGENEKHDFTPEY